MINGNALARELIESALVPVMEERLENAGSKDVAASSPRQESGGVKPPLQSKERAILSMTVCDPACGSGHFLLAAARRLGKELARIRTGEEEPTPKEFHLAVRDVISHCIYGVDVNPLAVDLCKLSLWLEGHWTGKPLSFLDHHIKCGNSLIGMFDPEVLKQGIPDDAFNPVTGDDKKAASGIKKRNKKERESPTRRLPFERTALGHLEDLAHQLGELSEVAEDSPADVKRKGELYRRIHESPESHRAHRAANLWTAAFFAPFTRADDPAVPTSETLAEFIEGRAVYAPMIGHADTLALKHRFFHWFLEFPEVFVGGGFDLVLGNPPWDMLQLDPQEFFARIAPEIAVAPTMAARQQLIAGLPETNPALFAQYQEAKHGIDAYQKYVHESGRFPLTSYGRINVMALFAELSRGLLGPRGRAGLLVPTGIATDSFNQFFFSDLAKNQALYRLVGFENEAFIFPAVHHSFKFCALTMTGEQTKVNEADFAFFCRHFADINDPERHFRLSSGDIALLNPNTATCPIFRTRADGELTKKIYRRVPVLVNEQAGQNPWGFRGLLMFMMNTDSKLFLTAAAKDFLPLYEGKMVHHFDHRYGTYEGATQANLNVGNLPQPSAQLKQDPSFVVCSKFWVPKAEVQARLAHWDKGWLLGFRDITSAVVERTAVFSVLPRVGVANNTPLAVFQGRSEAPEVSCFLANANSLAFDYIARQKIAGTHLNFFYLNQLPFLPPSALLAEHIAFIVPRVAELVYTAWDVKAFADDLWREANQNLKELIRGQWEGNKVATGGHEFKPPEWAEIAEDGIPLPPFKWDEDRRARIRAELDAYYALLYGLTRDELRYILDPKDVYGHDFPGETFRVLKEKEEKLYGEYRTRRLVLEAFDKLAESPRFRDEMPKHTSALQIPGKVG